MNSRTDLVALKCAYMALLQLSWGHPFRDTMLGHLRDEIDRLTNFTPDPERVQNTFECAAYAGRDA